MTRLTRYLLPTEKEAPADAEALSHKLMVRAGLVRQLGTGLWTFMPAGWRAHENVAQIVREEMDGIGCQEMLMPVINPADLWQRSGRYAIDEVFKFQDRKGAELVLALTHEEVLTFHVASIVRSYRQLPFSAYHFQAKGRDEARPRAGILRTREFIMKDAYTFDRDRAGLDEHYEQFRGAYDRIFDRCGLEWYRVESDVGMMGGVGAHEYMAPSPAGENDVALAPGYAANIEVASAEPAPVELPEPRDAPEEVATSGLTTIAEVARALHLPEGALLKSYPVMVEDRGLVLVVLRGDHQVNDIKLANALGAPYRAAREDEFAQRIGPAGSMGPVGADVSVLLDDAVAPGPYVAGANRDGYHLQGVEPGRDFPFKRGDVRRVEPGDTVDGHPIRIEPAIEVGNIFKLGTRFSEPFGATYLDESGAEQLIWMGSYGIGPARICAAAVEQYADEQGISWPRSISPFDVHLVSLGKTGTEERELAERLYGELQEAGLDVVYDDREDVGPGGKFADAELLGCPLRLTAGKRSLASGELEAQVRRGQESRSLPLEGAADAAVELCRTLA
ncbi:MAG TPA: proline--tRNA ligase [Solirubrobacteraceae bacterium]|nr:proline--tRNA ligase [Solirubrobacteraceae bacterium]